MFSIIAAIGKNNELGKDNGLCFKIKEDLAFFRQKTTGHKIVMGHRTWDSLPQKLPNRENIVISRHDFPSPDLIIHNIDQFIAQYKNSNEEIFIIGGGTVYLQFLPHAKTLYLTEVDKAEPRATTFFPEFNPQDYKKEVIKEGSEGDLSFAISKYTKEEI